VAKANFNYEEWLFNKIASKLNAVISLALKSNATLFTFSRMISAIRDPIVLNLTDDRGRIEKRHPFLLRQIEQN
jgi:hypothetical protein